MLLGIALLVAAALVAGGTFLLLRNASQGTAPPARGAWLAGGSLAVALAITAAGLLVRAADIELRGMTHVEVYVPGIELPEDISTPEPRVSLARTVLWHYFREPHPPAYYLMGWAWTKAFGTELWALRLPSVLFGSAAIFLVYLLAAKYAGRRVGALAALLLAFHGHHVLYSQYARMYALASFLALLSTWLWLRLLEERRPRSSIEVAYFATTTLALYTQTLLWVLLAAQMLYTLLATCEQRRPSRTIGLQLGCVIVGAPIVSQAILLSRPSPFEITPLAFLIDFLDFGFLFPPNPHPISGMADLPLAAELTFAALAVALLVAALRRAWPLEREARDGGDGGQVSTAALGCMAVGMALLLVALATNYRVWRRNELFAASALLPIAAWLGALLLPKLQPLLLQLRSALARIGGVLPGLASPIAVVALLPIAIVMVVVPVISLLVARGLLFSVPFLLIVISRGIVDTGNMTVWRGALAGFVVLLHVGGWVHSRGFTSLVGHRELAAQIVSELRPGDLVFANYKDWGTTPIFYHLQGHYDALVATGYAEAAARPATKRVFQIVLNEVEPTEGMEEALCGFELERTLVAQNTSARVRVLDPEKRRECTVETSSN